MATALAMNSNDDDSGETKLDAELKLFSSVTANTTLLFSYKFVKQLLWRVYENRPKNQLQNLCNALEFHMKYYQDRHQSICEVLHVIDPKTISCDIDAMLKFVTLRTKYKIQFYAAAPGLLELLDDNWPIGLERSRYDREFEEVSFLAGGGFGKVFRARNKLDGTVYAVKKVTIRSTTIKNVLVHIAEIKTLASLNHINIVPYKAAWLEPLKSPARSRSPNSTNGSSAMDDGEEEEDDDDDEQNGMASSKLEISDSLRRPEHDSEEFVLFEGSSGGPAVSGGDENRNREDPPRGVIKDDRSFHRGQPHLDLKRATLYIQITLCQQTLREWLDERNASEDFDQFYVKFQQQRFCDEQAVSMVARNAFSRQISQLAGEINPRTSDECLPTDSDAASRNGSLTEGPVHHLDVVLDVFQQLLNGLNYIHSRGIVHHDIKPSNIFVSRSDHDSVITVQLGDFGLSCLRQSSHAGVGFGTSPYAAPEQLEGKGKSDPKSDIYSLGIILLELLVPFSTDMERAKMIEEVLRGQYPPDLDRKFMELVKNLLQQQPSRRPEMRDLMKAVNVWINCVNVIAELRQSSLWDDEMFNLRKQIDEQKRVQLESEERKEQELRAKDEEICKLKEMLRKCQEKEEGNGQSGDANGQETNGAAC